MNAAKKWFLRFLSLLTAVAAWQVLVLLEFFPSHLLPSPSSIAGSFVGLAISGELLSHVFSSIARILAGFLIAAAVAIPLGVLVGWSRMAEGFFEPILEILRPIPPMAWIPIAMLWFGLGFRPAVFLIFIGSFFPILLNTVSGVKNTPRTLIEGVRTLGAGDSDVLVKVVIPSSIPSIAAGLRIGIGVGWMCLVAAEMVGTGSGLGYMIVYYSGILETGKVIVGMLVIGAIGYGMSFALASLERYLMRWRE